MYRRHNERDRKVYQSPDKMTLQNLKPWLLKSVSIGDGPDVIKELDIEQFMKIFSKSDPVLILVMKFEEKYKQINDHARNHLDISFEDI